MMHVHSNEKAAVADSTAASTKQAMNTAKPATAISLVAARLSITATITYQLLLAALIIIRPDLDPSWHTISEWAIGPYGWMMSTAFLISAASYAAVLVVLRSQLPGLMGRIARALLLICVIGTVGVGVFTTDPLSAHPQPLSTTGTLHIIFGTSALILLPVAALLTNLSLALKNDRWRSAQRVILWTAGLPLLGFTSFAVYTAIFVAPLGPNAYGPGVHIGWPPRIAFLTYMIWLITVDLQAIKIRQSGLQLAANAGSRVPVC
jgi:hypothetical membrane protein